MHDDRTVVAVRDCPKPPPTRISITLPTIRKATEVWIVTAGEGKAEAVAKAIGGAEEVDLPRQAQLGRQDAVPAGPRFGQRIAGHVMQQTVPHDHALSSC